MRNQPFINITLHHFSVTRTVIEMLEAENKDLKKNLSLAASRQNELKDVTICEQFEALFEKKSQYEALINEEQRSIAELEKQTREMEQRINKERKDMGGCVCAVLVGWCLLGGVGGACWVVWVVLVGWGGWCLLGGACWVGWVVLIGLDGVGGTS